MRKALKIVGVNVGLILVVAVVAELIFGGWIGTNYGTLVIPKDFKRRFDVSHLYQPTSVDGTILYRRDEHGLRGTYDDPSEIDILAIGGSTTNEIFVGEGETWSDVLARAFAENGTEITVVNAGVDGQTTYGHTKNFDLWFPLIPDLRADYVLAYVGINDQTYAVTDYKHKQDHLEAPRRAAKQYLLNNSALYTLFRNVRGMIRARRADLVHKAESLNGIEWVSAPRLPSRTAVDARMAPQLAAYADRLRTLIARIRDFGADAIIVTQQRGISRVRAGERLFPAKDPETYAMLCAEIDAFNRRAMAICREEGAICVDLADELVFEDGDHYDGLHTTPRGSEKIGRFLHAKLKDRLTFD